MAVNGIEAGAVTPAMLLHDNQQSNGSKSQFRKALKRDAKLRLAILGPAGSGKTYTLLNLATELGGRIALIDTEHGSASKYADIFDFDVLELDHFDPELVPALIKEVAAGGYSTLIIDSLSHFYMGAGGELEQVDQINARQKNGNSWAAWRFVTPKHTRMMDALIAAPIHVLVSMRVKTEWVVEVDQRTGKSAPRKVGLEPVMKDKDAVEYLFDVCGDMDQEHNLVVSKSRCPKLTDKMISKPGAEMAAILKEWLNTTSPQPQPKSPTPAQQAVADQKLHSGDVSMDFPWRAAGEMRRAFLTVRELVSEMPFLAELERYGYHNLEELITAAIRKTPNARDHAVAIYRYLSLLAQPSQSEVA